ncbi:MAG: hypothetical protein RML94_07695 [Bacteroidia bacterium]|nr:hypothetical protein [Bacteroidia bacterium]
MGVSLALMPTRSACCGLRYRFGAAHCSRTLRMPHAENATSMLNLSIEIFTL